MCAYKASSGTLLGCDKTGADGVAMVPVPLRQHPTRGNVRYEEVEGMGHDLPPRLLPAFVDWIAELVHGDNDGRPA